MASNSTSSRSIEHRAWPIARVPPIGRVFYCTLVDRKIVMLHQFVKKTDKTPPKELALARKRMKEWKNVDA
jgi:phage-related protein